MPGPYDIQQGQFGVQPPPNLAQLLGGPSAVTGGLAMQQNADYRNNMEIQNAINAAIQSRNQSAEQDWSANSPVRDQERLAAMARARAEAANVENVKRAEAELKSNEAKKSTATLEGDISVGKAANETKLQEARMKQHEDTIEELYRNFGDAKSPTALADVQKWFDDKKIPPNDKLRQIVGGATSSADLQARVKSVRDRVVNSIASQRRMIEEKSKQDAAGYYDLERARIGAKATTDAAAISANARRDTAASERPMTESQMRAEQIKIAIGVGDKPESAWTPEERAAVDLLARDAMVQEGQYLQRVIPSGVAEQATMTGKLGDAARKQIDEAKRRYNSGLPPAVRRRMESADPNAGKSAGEWKTGPGGTRYREK